MVLMRIHAVVGKDQIRGNFFLQFFKDHFYVSAHKGHKSVGKSFQQRSLEIVGADKQGGAAARLGFSNPDGAEDDPVKHTAAILFRQPKDCASAADLDIVGMRAKAQNLKRA